MILYKTLDGVVENGTEGVFLRLDGLRKLVFEVVGDAANERKWQILVFIGSNIDADEVDKALADEVFDGRIRQVIVNKLRQTRQKTVRQGLTIDAIDDLRQRKLRLFLKFHLQIFRQKPTIEVVQEALAHHSPTPFVAQNIT